MAVRWHGRGDVRLEEVPEPTTNDFADSLIEVTFCGICGTDVNEVRSGPVMISRKSHPLSRKSPPLILGHELSGVLVEGRSADSSIRPGDRVTVDCCLRCGKCAACVRGDYHLCRFGGAIGLHADGAFAPRVAVPSYMLVAVPNGITDKQAALTEPFAVGLHALDRAGATAATHVVILGFGPIGAATALLSRTIGAIPHVVEVDDARRQVAHDLGFPTIDASDDLPRRVRGELRSGGADVVIESTGVASMAPVAIECAARGGRIAAVGLPIAQSEIDMRRLTLFERSLVGCLGYRHDLPRVLELQRAGKLEMDSIVGSVVPLANAASELGRLSSSTQGKAIKTLVQMP